MINPTNPEEIKKLDPQDTLGSTDMLSKQCKAAWEEVASLSLPKHIEGIENIVFCGMGASIYGALVVKSLLGRDIPMPIELISDYFLPSYVNEKTLVVLTSYSGTTEETLACAHEALAANAKMLILTKSGPLAAFTIEHKIPAYIFDGKLNPSGVPRLGNGYTILGLLGLLDAVGVIDIEEHEVEGALIRLEEKFEDMKTQAMTQYQIFANKIPIIFAAEHLAGNAQILRNQFNETSKTFSSHFLIPDLNHHLMEGLQFPQGAPLEFLILNSPNYSEKIRRRIELTIEVVRQNNYKVYEFETTGQTIYDDFLEVLQYGSFLTLYLALHYNQNPAVNPWVDWFKKKLSEDTALPKKI